VTHTLKAPGFNSRACNNPENGKVKTHFDTWDSIENQGYFASPEVRLYKLRIQSTHSLKAHDFNLAPPIK
jgi:hypothetical protein